MSITACVIQGDIRNDMIDLIIKKMNKHFDHVILSTWGVDEYKFTKGDFEVVLNEYPENPGYSHRNYQRLSTANGLRRARSLGAEYVMKWRTDMLPTNLDIPDLVQKTQKNIYGGIKSRIVLPAFRNLTVKPDLFSSFPDYFAFGHIDEIELLWGDKHFDYSRSWNIPDDIELPSSIDIIDDIIYLKDQDYTFAYDAHVECYVLYKHNLEKRFNKLLDHPEIVKNYLTLIDHDDLKICWFDKNKSFRSITQALMFPWWTVKDFENDSYTVWVPGYKINTFRHYIGKLKSNIFIALNKTKQNKWLNIYLNENEQ